MDGDLDSSLMLRPLWNLENPLADCSVRPKVMFSTCACRALRGALCLSRSLWKSCASCSASATSTTLHCMAALPSTSWVPKPSRRCVEPSLRHGHEWTGSLAPAQEEPIKNAESHHGKDPDQADGSS